MITDRIENLQKYSSIFPGIGQLCEFMRVKSISEIIEKESFSDITLIPIRSNGVTETFNPSVLEAHKALMDVHVTLEGTDVIAYADLDAETSVFKPYEKDGDYLLANSYEVKTLVVPQGYFCVIPNNFAHMALYKGHLNVKKVVVKIKAENL